MTRGIQNWHVREFFRHRDRTQHEPTAAHIASPYEFGGKQQALAKDIQQRFHILCACNAAQKNEVAWLSKAVGKRTTVTIERSAISLVSGINIRA